MPTYAEREKRRARSRRQISWRVVATFMAIYILIAVINYAFDTLSKHAWEIERAGVLWGESVGGLCAGIECIGQDESAVDWDRPHMRLHLRNQGTEPVRIAHIAVLLHLVDAEPIEVRRHGERIHRNWRTSYGKVEADWFRTLEPGETVTEESSPWLRNWGLTKNYAADVRFVYERREAEVEAVNDARKLVTVTGLWTGRVESPPITVTRGLPGWPGRLLRIGFLVGCFALIILAGRHFRPRQSKADVTGNGEATTADASALPPSSPG